MEEFTQQIPDYSMGIFWCDLVWKATGFSLTKSIGAESGDT